MDKTNLNIINTGFLLTQKSFDRKGESVIELWLSTPTGPIKLTILGERSIFFIQQANLEKAKQALKTLADNYTHELLDLKTFDQEAVVGLYFKNLRAFYDARETLEQSNITVFEGGIRLDQRYLMERFIYGSLEFIGSENSKEEQILKGYVEYHDVKIKPNNYIPKFKMLSLDIECSEKGDLYSIGFHVRNTINKKESDFQKVIMIQPNPLSDEEAASDYIQWVEDEKSLLVALQQAVQDIDPDIIIGWNVINFDFRLLNERAELYYLKLKLGRGNTEMRWRDSRIEKNQGFVTIDGRMVIDGIAALKAESYSFPSFSLEAISQHFLGKGKATDDVENRLEEITHDFINNKVKLAHYNLQDCILVSDIFEKISLIDYLIFRSQLTGLELDRAGGSVAAFVNLYLPKLHREGYISPNLPEGGGLASPGGYVMNSKPGIFENVIVLDFKSLYPSIIRTFKIDPLGLIEGQKDPDDAIEGFRGGYFSRDRHLLPDIITELWAKRDKAKADNDKARSQAIKIIMNSFYGVLGSGGCPFYDTKLASSITLRGHEIMQQTALWIKEQGLEVIYGDTDSTFVLFQEGVSDDEVNNKGQMLVNLINKNWQDKLLDEHQIDSYLEIEFESHFSKFLMPTIRGSTSGSKKRYAGMLKTATQDKLIFKGLENVRADWTQLAKEFQLTLYQMIFNDQDPRQYILDIVKEILAGEKDDQLVYRKRLRRNLDSYIKNVPPHVRAARIADEENIKQGRKPKYQNKGHISYVMTMNGPQPIEYVTSAIDYQFYVDRQIEPVADGILPFKGTSFKEIVDIQMGLF